MTRSPDPALTDDLIDRWLPGAMFPSEVVWLAQQVRDAELDVLIECGRQDGVSTWALATLLQGTGTQILSVDFDEDPARLADARERLTGLPATCVSGDIHVEVPKLLEAHRGGSIGVVQDGPKGWEGLATLLAAAFDERVSLIAQHNLHIGHVTRTVFQMLSTHPVFLEQAAPNDDLLTDLLRRERDAISRRQPNRPVDHTSLGIIRLDEAGRAHLGAAVEVLRPVMDPWDPVEVRAHWDRGDHGYCSRLHSRSRFSRAHRKQR